jgi:hypothetical protein
MTLAVGFKGSEGIVLAADSRVTIQAISQPPGAPHPLIIPATYDNATKLLKVQGQEYVAAVTYNAGAVGVQQPRTAHSLLPEFEAQLSGESRLSVEQFAQRLSAFFHDQWNTRGGGTGGAMEFIVGGYDEGDAYGKLFTFSVPTALAPAEQCQNDFGIQWGGQSEITSRIINGYDHPLLTLVQGKIPPIAQGLDALKAEMAAASGAKIPYQFLPLQDCVDLSMLMIRTTAQILEYQIGIRGVGGHIDVATITRKEGFQYVQRKEIRGERVPRNLLL